jgi:secretin/TonB-like protein
MLDRSRSAVARWSFAALTLIVASAYPAFEVRAEERLSHPTIERDFDIPSQRLEDALLAYAENTGVEVFVDHALAANRQSGAVKGRFDVEAALQHLLVGTGLELRRAAERAYTLVEASPLDPAPDRPLPWSADAEQQQFFATLQLAIKRVVCARPETLPGRYRAALAIWIGPSGAVENVRVLGANGREVAPPGLVGDVQRISLDRPPPAAVKQPITLLILPRSLDRTGDCPSLTTRPHNGAPFSAVAP